MQIGANEMGPREVFLNLHLEQDIKTNEIPPIIRVHYLCGSSQWRSAIINNFDKRAPFIIANSMAALAPAHDRDSNLFQLKS